MKRLAIALGAGFVFGLGLVLAGATDPATVLGFLHPSADWDPRLLFMFLAGALSHGVLLRVSTRLRRPQPAASSAAPVARGVDARLLVGAAIFGVGWGLSGMCPGPALTALGGAEPAAAAFTLAMIAGMLGYDRANAAAAAASALADQGRRGSAQR